MNQRRDLPDIWPNLNGQVNHGVERSLVISGRGKAELHVATTQTNQQTTTPADGSADAKDAVLSGKAGEMDAHK